VCGGRTPKIAALTGETILCLSSIDWDFNWQGHQEIMSRLADHGNRVLFVENTGVRVPVVATGLEQVHGFNARHGPVVRIADGARAFAAAIREAVLDSSPAEAARRVDVARGNSWEARVAEMFRLVAAELARRRQATAGRPGSEGP
jgi:hypothetical protein